VEAIGFDGSAYLLADGPVGAIIGPGLPSPPTILPVASILAHREFDPYDGPRPRTPVGLADDLAAARRRFEAGEPVASDTT
jgi:hypothetical protein